MNNVTTVISPSHSTSNPVIASDIHMSPSTPSEAFGASCDIYITTDFDAYLQCLSQLSPDPSDDPTNLSSTDEVYAHPTMRSTYDGNSRVAFIFLYSVLFVLSLLGNFGVCFVVIRKSRMRSVTNFFLANQALSDVLMTVLNIPFVVTKQLTNLWAVGVVMCHIVDYMGVMSVYVSTFILTVIAIDRHRVIVHPLRPRITMSTAIVIDISIWLLAFLLAIPYAVFVELMTYDIGTTTGYTCIESYPPPPEHWQTYEYSIAWSTLVLQYIVPFIIIATSYISIGRKLWSTRAVGDTMAVQQAASDRRKLRTTRLLVLAVAVFGICWLPLHIYLMLTRYSTKYKHPFTYLCCHWFAMCSVCINPIAFCFLNDSLRSDMRLTIGKFVNRIRGTKQEEHHNNTLSHVGNPNSITHQSGFTSDASPRTGHKRMAHDDRNGNVVVVAAVTGNVDSSNV